MPKLYFRLRLLKHLMKRHDFYFPQVVFNIQSWGEKVLPRQNHKGCDTAACALGSAGLWKPFQRMGLKTVFKHDSASVHYQHSAGIYAAMLFFGITYNQANYLFMPWYYDDESNVTPDEVVEHINDVLGGKWK